MGDAPEGSGEAALDREGHVDRCVMLMQEPNALAGFPAASTTAMPGAGSPALATVLFGAWSQLIVAYWSGLDLLTNPFSEDDFVRGRISVRVMRDYSCAVRHPESFAFAEDLDIGPG